MLVSFRQKLGFEVELQNACHEPHLIFSVFPFKIELFTTPSTPFVSVLPIIFVTLLKNAQTQLEHCKIPLAGTPLPPSRKAGLRAGRQNPW